MSILTGKRTLECEVRINNIEGADIAKLFLNIFIFLLILVALAGSLFRPFGSFSLKTRSIRTLIVVGGFLRVGPRPHEARCPHPIHLPLPTGMSEYQVTKVVPRTIFFEMQLIELIFLREIQIIVCNKLLLFFLAF